MPNLIQSFRQAYPDHHKNMNDVTASLTDRILGETAFKHFKDGWNARVLREREEEEWRT